MDKAAISASRDLLERAKTASTAVDNAASLKEIETGWSNFLTSANRVFSKLEQGAKKNGKSNAWFNQKRVERRENALLRYLQHARNVDEHGLERVTERTQPGLALGVGPGAWRFDGTLGPGGTFQVTALGGQVPGKSKFVEKIPSKVKLVSVSDRGVSYSPPKDENGKELLPNDAAKSALVYLTSMVDEADLLAE